MGTVRRHSHSASLQRLWDAIVSIRQQRQVPNRERIAAFLKRKYADELPRYEEQLNLAIRDALIFTKTSKTHKGSKAGVEQESYRVPDCDLKGDGHDWYCFECHENGEVILCSTCHRVYHKFCLSNEYLESDVFICPICMAIKKQEPNNLNSEDLNLLLMFTCFRMKDKLTGKHAKNFSMQVFHDGNYVKNLLQIQVEEDELWRQTYLCYQKMDLVIMEAKSKDGEYESIEEFVADVKTIVHNIVIYFGVHNPLADLARQMLRDCLYDISEIRLCSDCYRMSNEKADKYWFCQPCDPPHDLVYAKQKGFPYWPAKVIRVQNHMYDVRFFGGHHERALVEEDNIKPIESSLQDLNLKKSVTLTRALDELKRHQMLLKQGITIQKDMTPLKRSQLAALKHPSRAKKKLLSPRNGHTSPDSGIEGNSSPAFKDVPTPEDQNVVTSTLESPSTKVCASTQTVKEPPPPCNCEAKYAKLFSEFRERMEHEHREDKERSLRDLAERLRADLEEEKAACVGGAVEAARRDQQLALSKLQAELQTAHAQQVQALIDRHKVDISETKKRQWCYNCEAEAIYHCCWNTSYCSVECQQAHWHKEHKRTCRRKR